MASCPLCAAVVGQPDKERRVYDTHLLSSENFVVIPAVGPITAGHIMVVSRGHFPNLASMGNGGFHEYELLTEKIRQKRPYSEGHLLEAEHGSSADASGGACISHVHVNLVPGLGSFANVLDETLPQLSTDGDLTASVPSNAPYIFMRGAGMTRLYEARDVPSQLIRRVILERMGRNDWDWAVFPQESVVEQTLRIWGRSGNL